MEPPLPIPSLQEFVSLAYSLETSVSIEIFIDFLGKRERERDTRIAQGCSTGELIDFRALFESSLTWKFSWNKLLFGLNTVIEHARGKRTVSQGR